MSNGAKPGRLARRRAIEEAIAALATRQHGVLTRAQLEELGVRPGAIRRRVDSGRLRRLHRGVFGISACLPENAPFMAAVLACGPESVLSHRSAAIVHGIIDRSDPDAAIDVTVPPPGDRRRPGICIHRLRLAADERTSIDGIATTATTRTLLDLATVLEDHGLERAIARAERERLVSAKELSAFVLRKRRRAGAPHVRTILERIGGPSLTRSEAERRFLALVRRARLPAPRANVEMAGYEIDFLWPELGVAVEVDGYRFHGSRTRFEADRRRNTRLAALGIHVVSLTWRQIVDDEVATAVQLGQVLMRARKG